MGGISRRAMPGGQGSIGMRGTRTRVSGLTGCVGTEGRRTARRGVLVGTTLSAIASQIPSSDR